MVTNKVIESNRKTWNKQQRLLRKILLDVDEHQQAITLFLQQHAVLHTATMAGTVAWSYEDALLDDMHETQVRRIPPNSEHSVAWLVWHIARIEDVTMNMLVAGAEQIYSTADWFDRLGASFYHTGNLMSAKDITELSATIDIQMLRDYRLSVGLRTREIAAGLNPEDLMRRVAPERLQRVLDVGAVLPEAQDLIDYWSRRTIAGLLLMPPTRHNFIHLNEALQVKKMIV